MAAPAAPAVPAVPPCVYDAPIAPAELQHEGFGDPPSRFTFNRRHFYKINDEYFDQQTFRNFNPEKYYTNPPGRLNQFNAYASNPANLQPITDAIMEMTRISISFPLGYECEALTHTQFNIFCSQSIASLLRMKLFCAFGMLHNYVNHSKIKLMVRGGMGLRLQLPNRSELISTAPDTDMDGLIVVDPSIGPAELDQFKTTFMKLLVLSIKSSIPHNATLTCKPAGGDSKNTIKVLVKTAVAEYELGDFGFKYSDDEIVEIYRQSVSIRAPHPTNPALVHHEQVNGIFPMRVQVYPGFLQCVWNFPNRKNMKSEYAHVFGNLMSESRERHLFHDTVPEGPEQRMMDKFETKMKIAERGFGGKKRTIKKYAIKRRGGSTTEQIGAAAQMRAFLPRHSATRNALNHIVHHESNNRFHDANYRHSPATQTVINKAFRAINANPRVSRRTKKQMKIAKQKASTHRR